MTASATHRSKLFEETTVVDVDVHVSHRDDEIRAEMASHLDEPYRLFVDPANKDHVGANMEPTDAFPKTVPGKLAGIREPVNTPSAIQGPLCEDFGVDYPILNSLVKLDSIPDTRQAVQMMEASNDVLLDRFLDGQDNFTGFCRVTTKDPARAAEEIDRLGNEDKIVGVMINNGATEKPEGDPRYDSIYQAAADRGLPIVYHATADISMQWKAPTLLRDLEKYVSVHAVAAPWLAMLSLTSLVFEGTPEKFPDLDFVFLEAGLSWVPYTMYRLNREYSQRRFDAPLLEKMPEEYVKDQFYFASQPLEESLNTTDLSEILQILGADSIMFATDHPHFDFDAPRVMDSYFGNFTAEEKEMILYKNARDVFDLDI